MNYRYQKPHPLLSDYVRSVLILDDHEEQENPNLPLVTNGMPAVVCKGTRATLFGRSVPGEHWQVGVVAYFTMPFMMAPLFNVDVRKLMSAPIHYEVGSFQDFLLENLEANRTNCEVIKYATDQIMFDPRPEVLKTLAISERMLQRLFKKFVGITPSQYRRVCQFQQSFTQLRSNDFDTLAAVAYENGFADQSHFIRAFKEFAETTPGDYLKSGLKEKK